MADHRAAPLAQRAADDRCGARKRSSHDLVEFDHRRVRLRVAGGWCRIHCGDRRGQRWTCNGARARLHRRHDRARQRDARPRACRRRDAMNIRTATDLRSALRDTPLVVGALGVLALMLTATLGPALAPYDPQAWRLVEFGRNGAVILPPSPPGPEHLLGTDPLGRDILSRLLWGAQLTLTAVAFGLVLRSSLGIGLGLAAAARGGWLDALMLAVTNAIAGVPQLLLALVLVLLFQGLGGLTGFSLALGLVGWSDIAQFTRDEARRLSAGEPVQVARSLGLSEVRVWRGYVVRNLVPQLVSLIALEAGSTLMLLAELGFIGFFVSGGTFTV